MGKGYICSRQQSLFGQKDVVGFGEPGFYVETIDRGMANKIIKENHYSGKSYNLSYIHLGVFIDGELMGVLQYGYAMNPSSCAKIVSGTENNQYLELNRMWLSDMAERNSESKAISYSIKYIKRAFREVKWIQSFADERCGGLGVVYQACSFSYYGEHKAIFWELDGEMFHDIQMTIKGRTGSASYLKENKARAKKHVLRQFRYLKFIDARWERRCLLKKKPYPKPAGAT